LVDELGRFVQSGLIDGHIIPALARARDVAFDHVQEYIPRNQAGEQNPGNEDDYGYTPIPLRRNFRLPQI
jgi:hypothetical protein